jgi:ribonuclease HI
MILIFDGGNGASTKKEAYGSFLLQRDDGAFLELVRTTFGTGYTNNEAEYKTLEAALIHIRNVYGVLEETLQIFGDSEVVRNQVGYMKDGQWVDVWQVNKNHLKRLRKAVRANLSDFTFTYTHMPRKQVVSLLGH